MRRFSRHPLQIPIEIHCVSSASKQDNNKTKQTDTKDLGRGGLSCTLSYPLDLHSQVAIHIPSVCPEYHGNGEVIWCRETEEGYDIGIAFADAAELFKSRMVQQVCQIERYKNSVYEEEGRELDDDQAAMEWIEKYAAEFPNQ